MGSEFYISLFRFSFLTKLLSEHHVDYWGPSFILANIDLVSLLNFSRNFQNGMSGAEAPGPDAVAQAEEAKARANEFFKTEKYPLVLKS